jgi:hypothetical protein
MSAQARSRLGWVVYAAVFAGLALATVAAAVKDYQPKAMNGQGLGVYIAKDSSHVTVRAPYDEGGYGRVGFMQGVADIDSVTIPWGRWWAGLDFRAELDNGPMTPYTRAMGADIGVTVYQDTGHVGAITGASSRRRFPGAQG